MKNSKTLLGLGVAMALGMVQVAQAHTSFVEKIATANTNFYATLNVGHGCGEHDAANIDTYKLVLDIPAEVSGLSNANIRPMEEAWGKASIERNTDGKITKLIWTKPDGSYPRAGADDVDSWGYRTNFLVRLPNAPFTKVVFPAATQFCKKADGTIMEEPWKDASAPTLYLLPAIQTGWNKFTAPADMTEADIKAFFAKAHIVWVGDAAYSPNAITASSITTKLTSISKDAEIWAKF